MKFPQVRLIKDMVNQLFSGKSSPQGVSSFRASPWRSVAASAPATSPASPPPSSSAAPAPSSGCGPSPSSAPAPPTSNRALAGLERTSAWRIPWWPRLLHRKRPQEPPARHRLRHLTVFGCGLALPGIQIQRLRPGAAHSLDIDPWISGFIYTVLVAYVVLGGGRRSPRRPK